MPNIKVTRGVFGGSAFGSPIIFGGFGGQEESNPGPVKAIDRPTRPEASVWSVYLMEILGRSVCSLSRRSIDGLDRGRKKLDIRGIY